MQRTYGERLSVSSNEFFRNQAGRITGNLRTGIGHRPYAFSGDQAGSEASPPVGTWRSLKPVMSMETSRAE